MDENFDDFLLLYFVESLPWLSLSLICTLPDERGGIEREEEGKDWEMHDHLTPFSRTKKFSLGNWRF